MLIDLDEHKSCTFRAPVCIIGGGIAGLTLASTLAARGIECVLLEAGGSQPELRSQQLYTVETCGIRHNGAQEGRFRTFGGSSTKWGGQLLPYTEDVLNPPPECELPSWPITLNDLEPHYDRIYSIFEVEGAEHSARLLEEFGAVSPLGLSSDMRLRFSAWSAFHRRNLAQTLGKRLSHSRHITICLHANAREILLTPNGVGTEAVLACNYNGEEFRFEAKCYIVASGTIESVRLLLASRRLAPNGVGNSYDQLGRYFHDHIGVNAAIVPVADLPIIVKAFAPYLRNGILHTPKIEATSSWRARHGALSIMAHFPIEEPDNSGAAAVRSILRSLQHGKLNWAALTQLPQNFGEIVRLVWSVKVDRRRAISKRAHVRLNLDCEQWPDSDNRITLSEHKDALGMPIARLHWRVGERERCTIAEYSDTVNALFRRMNIEIPHWRPELKVPGDAWLNYAADTFHMMGGARMGTNATNSVVDSNLRVHGVDNLWIASCAVFPTGGSSNPTFTMMALTLRLADALTQRLQS